MLEQLNSIWEEESPQDAILISIGSLAVAPIMGLVEALVYVYSLEWKN